MPPERDGAGLGVTQRIGFLACPMVVSNGCFVAVCEWHACRPSFVSCVTEYEVRATGDRRTALAMRAASGPRGADANAACSRAQCGPARHALTRLQPEDILQIPLLELGPLSQTSSRTRRQAPPRLMFAGSAGIADSCPKQLLDSASPSSQCRDHGLRPSPG
jgi:hypothetical protein